MSKVAERQKSEKKFRKNYEVSPRNPVVFPEQGRTKQAFKDECDINNIMRRFETSGALPHMIVTGKL